MTIPTTPGGVTPATRNPAPLRRVMYQIDGAVGDRWGSLARRGLPVTVRLPATTQLLLAARPKRSPRARAPAPGCALPWPARSASAARARDGVSDGSARL